MGGTFITRADGTIDAVAQNLTVTGATTLYEASTVTSTSGTLTFTGAVTSTGLIGSNAGSMMFSSTLVNNGTLDLGTGVVTTTGHTTSTGTILIHASRLEVMGDFNNSGTFTAGTGNVRLTGTADQRIGTLSTYNLTVDKSSGTATLQGHVTSTNAFAGIAGTLAIGAYNLDVTSTFTNTATITRTTGRIAKGVGNVEFRNASGKVVTFSTDSSASVYIRVTDLNRNLLGAALDTISVPVTVSAAGGGDSERIILTETGVATGIFQNSTAIALATTNVISASNTQFELTGTGVLTVSYTDVSDALDVSSTTATATYVSPTVAASSGGGGGGSGSSAIVPAAVTETVAPSANVAAQLANLTAIGQTVNNLVKLPDDGNPATQADSAVYYIGADGARHAFPNAQAYFTWYPNFDTVTVIAAADLATIPLGTNVTYQPGDKMVKFTTLNNVYAVDVGGVLRWIKSEQIATELYGATWNKQIDDINDAFFTNYTFGTDINGLVDFNPELVESTMAYPSDSM